MSGSPELAIVIPAYDEVDRIPQAIERSATVLAALASDWEIIVVADGGPAALRQAAEAAAARIGRTRVLVNDPNRGKGYTVRRGVLASSAAIVGFLDADLAQPPEALPAFVDAIRRGADLAIGTRVASDDPAPSAVRRLSSALFAGATRLALDLPFQDLQCGMKVFAGRIAHPLFEAQRLERFAFDAELLAIAVRWGLRVAEVPVTVEPQTTSTVRVLRDGPRMLADVVRVRRRLRRLPPPPADVRRAVS